MERNALAERVAVATVEAFKEERAGIELMDCIFPYDPQVSFETTKYPGVIILRSRLSPFEIISILRKCFVSLTHKVVPIQKWAKASIEEIVEACIEIAKISIPKNSTFKVECGKRGRIIKSRSAIERAVGRKIIEEIGCKVSMENPEYIVAIEVIGKIAGVCIAPKSMIWRRENHFRLPLY
ncbi:MAG: THUMP domain-containing protein [archaeon GB-1867-005]|nr:THUMP domain-containing protein [Candidatus Culexmicrobium cathedralense]